MVTMLIRSLSPVLRMTLIEVSLYTAFSKHGMKFSLNVLTKHKYCQAIGPHEDLTTVKQRKLRWYGHITRSTGLAKTVMQGTVQGGRRRGRQRKRWEDNIPEWTGLTLGAAMRKAERREEWRELVAKSSVVPQRSTETTG